MVVWPLRGVVLVAVVLAALVARRAPQHRPVAVALGAALALDVLRALAPLRDGVALALYCAPAALSVWVAWSTFGAPVNFWAAGQLSAAACWILPLAVAPPALVPTAALAVSVAVQGVLVALWHRRRGPLTVSQACALVLLLGDLAGLLGPAGPLPWPRSWAWLTAAQAALIAAALVGVQGAWLARQRNSVTPAVTV